MLLVTKTHHQREEDVVDKDQAGEIGQVGHYLLCDIIICHVGKQRRRSTAQLISAFVFALWMVQSIFLNLKLQDSVLLLWLFRLVCV